MPNQKNTIKLTSPQIFTPKELLDEVIPLIQERGTKPELPTGIDPLDKHLWGLRRKSVTVVSGRPAEGKSSMVGQIAWNLALMGKRVIYLSIEMSREEIVERYLCSYCEINSDDLRKGVLPSDFDEKVERFRIIWESMNMRIINYGRDLAQLRQVFEMFKDVPDVLVIDHIQRISGTGFQERRDAITEYMNTLEGISQTYNMAVLVASQLNRDTKKQKDSRPTIENLKESGSLEETGATVLMLHWPGKDAEATDPGKWDFRVIIGKQRSGPSGIEIPLEYQAYFYRFRWPESNATEWKAPENGSQPIRDITESKTAQQESLPF